MTAPPVPLAGPGPLIDVHAHFFFADCGRAEWDNLNRARFRAGGRIGISYHIASILGSWGRWSPTYFASPTPNLPVNPVRYPACRSRAG